LNVAPVELAGWLGNHIGDLNALHPEKRLVLLPSTACESQVDIRLFERVLDNLINNALRYCQQRVDVQLICDGGLGLLTVDDDGPGIPENERSRVFEPFVRLDPSRDRATGGCGLGLAIVSSIATAMGGTVTAGQSPLGGARFSFRWPLMS